MAELKEMNEELNTIRKAVRLKGKKTIDTAGSDAEFEPGMTKTVLLTVITDLFAFSKKALKKLETTVAPPGPEFPNFEEIIKRQLTDIIPLVLPGLLKTALSTSSEVKDQEAVRAEEKPLPVKHTLTLVKKTEEEGGETSPITENDWVQVRRDVKGSLAHVPVAYASLFEGTATLNFSSKDHLDEAQKVLAPKYDVATKSEERKKLDPKLSINDIHTDIKDKDMLLEELLQKNENIRSLSDGADKVKIIFYDTKQRFAVVQVSPVIRESIRQNADQVNLDLTSHYVKDRIHVVQCYHCQEFGHMAGSKYCKDKDKDPTCFYCAGKHKSKDCNSKKENKYKKIKCSNCTKSKNHSERNAATTHKASDSLCPSFIKERAHIMSRTAGCGEAKNAYLQRVKELKAKLGRV